MTRDLSHTSAVQLLPWYANGTLSAAEWADMEHHLSGCDVCRAELESLRVIQTAMTGDEDLPPVRASSLASTLAAVDDWERARSPMSEPTWRVWLRTLWSPPVPLARAALAVQMALILALGTVLVVGDRAPSFTTLSGPGDARGGVRLTVVFRPEAAESDIRRLLLANGATMVSGPSSQGVYIVELIGRQPDDPRTGAAIEALRQENSVIRFVEVEP